MSKIVFLDVDGTLVDYHNRLPASAADAVARARAAGHRVVLCTGRSRAEVPDFLWALDADGFVGGNGGYVEYDGAVVLHRTLTGGECRAVVAWLPRANADPLRTRGEPAHSPAGEVDMR